MVDRIEFYTNYVKVILEFQESGCILYSVLSNRGHIRRTGCLRDDVTPIINSIMLVKKAVKARNNKIKQAKLLKIADSIMRQAASELDKHGIKFKINCGNSDFSFEIYCGTYGKLFCRDHRNYYLDGLKFKHALGDPDHNIIRSLIKTCKILKKLKKVSDADWIN